ncbi:MAG TPA: TonB family protein [Macromonas sp.]|nr:TonB family protein [Macromonas sp.]
MFRQLSTLQIALAISLLAHAALLTVRFVAPQQFNRVFQDTPLEVVLVNSRSDDKPDKAQAIAQANLAGGGEADKGRATSPLPPSAQARLGDALEEEERRVEAMKDQQNRLLAQIRKKLASMPVPDPNAQRSPDQQEREQKRQALVKILAEIERRINEENARPRRRYISPSTREEAYAVYYNLFKQKVEERGTANFPQQAGRKLYGELVMIITINHNGKVLDTEVVQASGQDLLDRQAQAIVRGLSFGRFTADMRRRADQIVVVTRFRFTREETLQTQITAQ